MFPTLRQGKFAVKRAAIFSAIIFVLSATALLLNVGVRFGPTFVRSMIQPIAISMGLQTDQEALIVLISISAASAFLTFACWGALRILGKE